MLICARFLSKQRLIVKYEVKQTCYASTRDEFINKEARTKRKQKRDKYQVITIVKTCSKQIETWNVYVILSSLSWVCVYKYRLTILIWINVCLNHKVKSRNAWYSVVIVYRFLGLEHPSADIITLLRYLKQLRSVKLI